MRTRGLIRLRAIAVAVLMLSAFSLGMRAHVFSAEAVGTGTLVARIPGLEISATLVGELEWTGEAVLDGQPVRCSARGTFSGVGVSGIVTMISEGWVAYSLSGSSDDGEPVEIRGLLYVKWEGVIPLKAGDPIVGTQHTVLLIGGRAHAFSGDFTGAAQGQLEPADVAMTIQLGGAAIVHLAAVAEAPVGELPASIPIGHPALSSEILRQIDELLSLGGGSAPDGVSEP